MAVLITADTLTNAWMADLEHLRDYGREELNLVTMIADPNPDRVNVRMIQEIDGWLLSEGKQRVETVASTIFPASMLRGRVDREDFYRRYLELLPRLRMQAGNGKGTYFGRLIEYPATADVRRGATMNQVEGVILKLQTQIRSGRAKQFNYQAQVFAPGRDDTSPMGFPCLSFLSFQIFRDRLCLMAVYRNHYYFQRALGNFIGLARLQKFIASEAGIEQGSLTVHACHGEIDVLGKRKTEQLILACRGAASTEVVS